MKEDAIKSNIITPDAIISEMGKLSDSMKQSGNEVVAKNQGVDFPIDVLPYKMQRILREARATIGFPEDYLGSSMLVAIATAIGNTMMVEHIPGWKENSILFLALVGRPGACKSHPLSFAMQPLVDHDSEMAAQFEKEMRQYLDTLSVPTKKRAEQGLEINPREPVRKRFIISDITPEAVHRIHSQNKRGLCLVSDEFSGWFKNFNRYNNGSESEFWMSVFSHKFAMADRKSSANGIFIRHPFICVCGTIQPEILWELASNSRSSNGFLERILFVIPINQNMGKWNKERRQPTFPLTEEWKSVLEKLMSHTTTVDANGDYNPRMLDFTQEAIDILFDWQNETTDRCNAGHNDTLRAIASKLEIYAVRFCLILQAAYWACGEGELTITAETVSKAIRLTEYFRATATKVRKIITEQAMPDIHCAVLAELPERFTTAEGVAIAVRNGMPERTFKQWLKDKGNGILFAKESHGKYSKI